MKCFTHEKESCTNPECRAAAAAKVNGCQRPACVAEREQLRKLVTPPINSTDDKSIPEDKEILAAHPAHGGSHTTYAEAHRLVSAKYTKHALVALVNWLLLKVEVQKRNLKHISETNDFHKKGVMRGLAVQREARRLLGLGHPELALTLLHAEEQGEGVKLPMMLLPKVELPPDTSAKWLWAHLVSEHATILDVNVPLEELEELHQHEHEGPGTIRNHPLESRVYSLRRIGEVLSEAEPSVEIVHL